MKTSEDWPLTKLMTIAEECETDVDDVCEVIDITEAQPDQASSVIALISVRKETYGV